MSKKEVQEECSNLKDFYNGLNAIKGIDPITSIAVSSLALTLALAQWREGFEEGEELVKKHLL
tara:strand:+ start:2494 stop:2682 length:189 start_codon:yes stop_codon:yes gene_type:complete